MTKVENNKTEHKQTPPSTATLIRTGIIAILSAAFVLTIAILPAEYGIDPTGIGKKLGLTALSGANESSQNQQTRSALPLSGVQKDTVSITVPANDGLEYKFHVKKGDSMKYTWSSEDGSLFFDFHGEPDGDTSGFFESYTVSIADNVHGTFTASFDGVHGWYWQNESYAPITISLKTEGIYKVVGLK